MLNIHQLVFHSSLFHLCRISLVLILYNFFNLNVYGQGNNQSLITNGTNLKAYSIIDDIVTFHNPNKTEIWQVNKRTKDIQLQFEYSKEIEAKVYESYYQDKGKAIANVYKAYAINGVKGPVSKVTSLSIDEKNQVYVIVLGYQAQQDPNGVIGVDFRMNPFFVLLQILKNDSIIYLPIHTPMLYDKYYLADNGSFFRTQNGFALAMFREEESVEKNPFLAEFNIVNKELVPSRLFENIYIPNYHIKSKFSYGMLNYRKRGEWIMFYSSNSMININSGKEIILYFDKMLKANPDFVPYKGATFNIPFSTCDFFFEKDKVKVIYRMDDKFYLNQYALDFKFINSRLLNIKTNEIETFPMFNEKGEVFIQPKETSAIKELKID